MPYIKTAAIVLIFPDPDPGTASVAAEVVDLEPTAQPPEMHLFALAQAGIR